MNLKQIFKYLIIAILVAFLFMVITFPFTYGMAVMEWTDDAIKKEMNNPYVNNEFEGWKKVRFEEGSSILIPSEWEMNADGDSISIQDGEKTVARGYRIPSSFKNESRDIDLVYEQMYEKLFAYQITERRMYDLAPTNLGTGATYGVVTCSGAQGERESHYILELKNTYGYLYYIDFGELYGTGDPQFDYIEAMAYSFNLKEQEKDD